MSDTPQALRDQLLRLRELHASGKLKTGEYDSARTPLERLLVDAVLAAPAIPSSTTAAAKSPAPPPEAAPRAGAGLWLGGLAAAVLVAGLGYAWTRPAGEIGQPPPGFAAGSEPAQGGGSAPHELGREQIESMVAKLAERLQQKPDDAEGWAMLGRSFMALNRGAEAVKAYERAQKLRPEDANALADLADALAVTNGRTLDGEPTRLVERALKLDPDNLKALALAGTAAFNRGDFATAVKHWDRAAQTGPADSPIVEMARSGAAEARARGNLPAAPGAAAPAALGAGPAPGPKPTAAAPGKGSVQGMVTLSPALKAQAAPDDTVFIFARPAEGSRMPLALVRKQVKDLPFNFVLDDSSSMSPAARLSGAQRVVVGARITKSGQAMPQPGDLEGLSAPVDVGASGVNVEIARKLP